MSDDSVRQIRLVGVVALPVGRRIAIQTYEKTEFTSSFSLQKVWASHSALSIEDLETGTVHHQPDLFVQSYDDFVLRDDVRQVERLSGTVLRCHVFHMGERGFTLLDVNLETATTPYRG